MSEPPSPLDRPVSIHERGFLHIETAHRPQVVSGVVILGGRIDPHALSQRLADFANRYPHFQCRLEGHHWRRDPGFQITNHFEIRSIVDRADLLENLSQDRMRSLCPRHPPWKILLTTWQEDGHRRSGLLLTAHHALLDGLVGLAFLGFLSTDQLPPPPISPSGNVVQRPRIRGRQRNWLAIANSLWVANSEMLLRQPQLSESGDSPSADRQILTFCWPRKELRIAGQRLGASLQETVLLVLTRFLRNAAPRFQDPVGVRAILPLTRAAKPDSEVVTNRHDVGFIHLPVTVGDIDECCRQLKREMDRVLAQRDAHVFPIALRAMRWAPSSLQSFIFRRWSSRANLLISFLPAGPSRQTVLGADITDVYAFPALPNRHSLVIGVMANRRQVTCTVQVDMASDWGRQHLQAAMDQAFQHIAHPQDSRR